MVLSIKVLGEGKIKVIQTIKKCYDIIDKELISLIYKEPIKIEGIK